ncbi:RidA family protein [Prauserella endophytica]|uniref:RidA family protein n=1 Tax=Prauserella endophytica TaxID=1592324 RepID=A0ABY2RZJ4_9PSEU|nr:RidA family protein [Prauserella endophytica]TKG66625.1 RidA family protein [Prauserella endophytica]
MTRPVGSTESGARDGNTSKFSPCRKAGGFVFVSGQASVENGAIVPGTFEEEMRRSIENVRRILEGEGLSLADVVRVGAYVEDPADVPEFNRLYLEYFHPPLPARTTIANCLGGAVKFEIDVVAFGGA